MQISIVCILVLCKINNVHCCLCVICSDKMTGIFLLHVTHIKLFPVKRNFTVIQELSVCMYVCVCVFVCVCVWVCVVVCGCVCFYGKGRKKCVFKCEEVQKKKKKSCCPDFCRAWQRASSRTSIMDEEPTNTYIIRPNYQNK